MSWILLVDDEPNVTRLMKHRLEAAGYRVETAPHGEAALEKLEARSYDLMITDLCMPRMGGRELCEAVRKLSVNQDVWILVVTSRPEDEMRAWTRDFENLEFIEKPVSVRNLLKKLDGRLGPGPSTEESEA